MKNVLLLFLLLACGLAPLWAQNSSPEVLSTAGESYEGQNTRIDWTIGELAISTIQGADQQVTQGFHQPYYLITSIEELPEAVGQIAVFPNPTAEQLSVELSFERQQDAQVRLLDAQGKLMLSKSYQGQQIREEYLISHLPTGTYFLSIIINDGQYLSTHKIQKIK